MWCDQSTATKDTKQTTNISSLLRSNYAIDCQFDDTWVYVLLGINFYRCFLLWWNLPVSSICGLPFSSIATVTAIINVICRCSRGCTSYHVMELHKVSLGEYKVICKLQNTYLLFTGREVRVEKKLCMKSWTTPLAKGNYCFLENLSGPESSKTPRIWFDNRALVTGSACYFTDPELFPCNSRLSRKKIGW